MSNILETHTCEMLLRGFEGGWKNMDAHAFKPPFDFEQHG